jgi:putative sigma-54 modulation protein
LEIKVAVRHFEPPDGMKREIEKKLEDAVLKHFGRVLDASAVVSMENSRYHFEVDVKVKGTSFHSHSVDYNVHQCMEEALKKLETQMRRYKDKKVSLKKKNKNNGVIDENT